MRTFSRLSVLVIGAGLLGACGTTHCDRVDPYQTSRASGNLKVPAGLSQPDEARVLRVPDAGADKPVRGPCQDAPPPSALAKKDQPADKPADAAALPAPPTIAPPVAGAAGLPAPPSVALPEATGDPDADAKALLTAWLATWRLGDDEAHAKFYSQAFVPPANGGTRDDWLQRRQEILRNTGEADVRLDRVTLAATDEGVRARFIQEFWNGGQINALIKELELVREDGQFRIVSERVVEVL